MKAKELLDSRLITGPAFLWEKENKWPTSDQEDNQASHELQQNDPEVKKSVAMATTATAQIEQADSQKLNLAERVEYFSDWHRAKRAVALCQRYVRCLRDRVHKKQCNNEETRSLK
ncbi:hypothetical protein OS493_039008, partial [Desmophyllum pertusum]